MENICFYNNFGANHINIIPEKLIYSNMLLNEYIEHIRCNCYPKNEIVVFGDYDVQKLQEFAKVIKILNNYQESIYNQQFFTEVLDSWGFLIDNLCYKFQNKDITFIITQELFINLEDVRPLFLAIKKLMLINAQVQLLFIYQNDSTGYWNFSDTNLKDFFKNSGFQIKVINSKIIQLEYTEAIAKEHLHNNKINGDTFNYNMLMITADGITSVNGGIGTYVKTIINLNPNLPCLYLPINHNKVTKYPSNVFVLNDFFNNSKLKINIDYYIIELLKCILFLLPSITIIESEDHPQYLFRLIQAKKNGILPQYLQMQIVCHGNIDHSKYCQRSINYANEDLREVIKSAYVYENADLVITPTDFIKNLYMNTYGYKINNNLNKRLPFMLNIVRVDEHIKLNTIKNIVYIGNNDLSKGLVDFIKSIQLLKNTYTFDFNVITITHKPLASNFKNALKSVTTYTMLNLSHQKVLDFINQHRNNSLFIIPYPYDNHPYVLLELLLLKTLFIAYNAGGIPSVVEYTDAKEFFLCMPNAQSLTEKINEILHKDLQECSDFINFNHKRFLDKQKEINEEWSIYYKESQQKNKQLIKKYYDFNNWNSKCSIIIPIYNTNLNYVKELLMSINNLRNSIQEIIFINDGSKKEYSENLELEINKSLNQVIAKQIIHQDNKGLAATRNIGLKAAKSNNIFVMDSDDIFFPNTIIHALIAKFLNQDYLAVTGSMKSDDSLNPQLNLYRFSSYTNVIYGNCFGILGLIKNEFLNAHVLVDKNLFLKTSGYDDSNKAAFEDWAFYLKNTFLGFKFDIIPQITYFYRHNKDGILNTYSHYDGYQMVIKNIPFLDYFNAKILFYNLQNHNTLDDYLENNGIKNTFIAILKSRQLKLIYRKLGIFNFLKKIYFLYR